MVLRTAMQLRLSIITVHKGPLLDLKRTIDSIYLRLDGHTEHILVARLNSDEVKVILEYCYQSKLVVNKDRSLYDAMNIGLRYSEGQFVNFINSGDELCAPIPTDELKEKKCFIYAPTLNIDKALYTSSASTLNHQNFIAPKDNDISFEEKYHLFADARWMNSMVLKYGANYQPHKFATFHYGGLSTRPSLLCACHNIRLDIFFLARIKLLIKALFVSFGLERINKSMLRRSYR